MTREVPTTPEASLYSALLAPKIKARVENLLPKGYDVKKVFTMALMATRSWPADVWKNVDEVSFIDAVCQGARLGVPADGRRANLIPYRDRKSGVAYISYQAQYTGLMDAIKRADPSISSIMSAVIYEFDEFEYVEGSERRLIHKRGPLGKKRGKMIGAYAMAHLKDCGWFAHVMDAAAVLRRKACAKSSKFWDNWPEEMWRKTPVKELAKWFHESPELAELLKMDDADYNPAQIVEEVSAADFGPPGGNELVRQDGGTEPVSSGRGAKPVAPNDGSGGSTPSRDPSCDDGHGSRPRTGDGGLPTDPAPEHLKKGKKSETIPNDPVEYRRGLLADYSDACRQMKKAGLQGRLDAVREELGVELVGTSEKTCSTAILKTLVDRLLAQLPIAT